MKPSRKPWREKMNPPNLPKLVEIPGKWANKIGPGTMLIATPALIDKYVRTIPKGKTRTVNQVRGYFAKKFKADTTCPLTTGIFLNILAHAAEEDKLQGKKNITPYWRVVKEKGKLNPKYPGGAKQQCAYLKKEGLIIKRGKSENSWKVVTE